VTCSSGVIFLPGLVAILVERLGGMNPVAVGFHLLLEGLRP
jgi:hypothetical protein